MQKKYRKGDLCFASEEFYSLGSMEQLRPNSDPYDIVYINSEETGRLFMILGNYRFGKKQKENYAYIVYSFKARTIGWVYPYELQ